MTTGSGRYQQRSGKVEDRFGVARRMLLHPVMNCVQDLLRGECVAIMSPLPMKNLGTYVAAVVR